MEPVPAAKEIREAALIRTEQPHAGAVGEAGPAARKREVQCPLFATVQDNDERRGIVVAEARGRIQPVAPDADVEGAGKEAHAAHLDTRTPPAAAPEA